MGQPLFIPPLEYVGENADGTAFFFRDGHDPLSKPVVFSLDEIIRHRNFLTEFINKRQQPVYDMLHAVNSGNVGPKLD